MRCDNCGHDEFRHERVDRTFNVNGQVILVEHIPAHVCERCGDPSFDASVGERVRMLVREPARALRPIQGQVFRYDAA